MTRLSVRLYLIEQKKKKHLYIVSMKTFIWLNDVTFLLHNNNNNNNGSYLYYLVKIACSRSSAHRFIYFHIDNLSSLDYILSQLRCLCVSV